MKWIFLFVVLLNIVFFGWQSIEQGGAKQTIEPAYGPPISEKIRLLSEAPTVTEVDDSTMQKSNLSLEEALNNALTVAEKNVIREEVFCPRVEVERKADKQQIEGIFRELNWTYQVNEIVMRKARFWLYIPAPAEQKLSDGIVKALADKSIDSFVINRGEMKNRISLGLYSSMARAEQAGIRIQQQSEYSVEVYEHMRNVPVQQLDIGRQITEKEWAEFLSRVDLAKMIIKIEKNPC